MTVIWRGERFDPLNLHGSHCVQCANMDRCIKKDVENQEIVKIYNPLIKRINIRIAYCLSSSCRAIYSNEFENEKRKYAVFSCIWISMETNTNQPTNQHTLGENAV